MLSRKSSLAAGTSARTRKSVIVNSSLFENTIADAMPTRTSAVSQNVPPPEPTSQSTPLGPLATQRSCHQFRDAKDNAAAAVNLQETAAVAELSMGNELGLQEQQGSTLPGQSQQPPPDPSPREDVEILPTRRLDLDKVDFKTFVYEPEMSSSPAQDYTANEASTIAAPITLAHPSRPNLENFSPSSTRPPQEHYTSGRTRVLQEGQQRDPTRSHHHRNGDSTDVKSQRGEASPTNADTSPPKTLSTSSSVTSQIKRAFPHAELGTPGVRSSDPLHEEVNVCAHSEPSTLSTYDDSTSASLTTSDHAEPRNDLLTNDWEQEFHPWRWKHCEINPKHFASSANH